MFQTHLGAVTTLASRQRHVMWLATAGGILAYVVFTNLTAVAALDEMLK